MTLDHPIGRVLERLIIHGNDLLRCFDLQQKTKHPGPFLRGERLDLVDHVSRRHG